MIAIESVSQKAQLSPAWATSVASMSRGEGDDTRSDRLEAVGAGPLGCAEGGGERIFSQPVHVVETTRARSR